jgi:hypothetical protein
MNGPVRRQGSQGRLIASGYVWEATRPKVQVIMLLLLGLGGLGLALMISSFFNPIKDIWIAAVGAVVCLPAAYVAFRFRLGQCGFIFHERGPVEAPYGLPWPRIHKKHLPCAAAEVKSVGMLQSRDPENRNLYSVVLYLHNGDVIHLTSKDYKFELAHKVASELTNALEELRAPRVSARY